MTAHRASPVSRTPRLSSRALMVLGVTAFLASCSLAACDDDWTPAGASRVGYGTTPVWSDEFDGTFDTQKWLAEDVAWWNNGELEYYSPDAKYVNTTDGVLGITATTDVTGGRNYTSARISTRASATFRRGLYAARIRMPRGAGIWPAFWLFGTGAMYSEIDIAELVGGDSALTTPPTGSGDEYSSHTLIHFATEDGGPVTQGPGCSHHLADGAKFSDDYHVYWLEWTETEVWSGVDLNDMQKIVDDISQLTAFQAHMYIILNVAVGGFYPGDPDSTTPFPQTMEVDWVRVWAKDGEDIMIDLTTPTTTPSSTGTDVPVTDASSTATTTTPTDSTGESTPTDSTGSSTPTDSTGGSSETDSTAGSTPADGSSGAGDSTTSETVVEGASSTSSVNENTLPNGAAATTTRRAALDTLALSAAVMLVAALARV